MEYGVKIEAMLQTLDFFASLLMFSVFLKAQLLESRDYIQIPAFFF